MCQLKPLIVLNKWRMCPNLYLKPNLAARVTHTTMTENEADTAKESSEKTLDLSGLTKLDFGPLWAGKSKQSAVQKGSGSNGKSRNRERASDGYAKRDRRMAPGGNPAKTADGRSFHSGTRSKYGKESSKQRDQSEYENFQPPVTIDIYPQDDAFDALVKRLRSSVRTYQLFELARLILEKPERYQVVVQNKTGKGEKPKQLYYTLSGSLPFETEEAAITHFINNDLDTLFNIETIEVEPPKGNFQMVNRCTVTGDFLGPPNYHRYQEFLQRHYATKIDNMSFEQFVSKVEPVKEQESIDAWMESMKQGARYTLKEHKEGEPESFESLETIRLFLVQNRKDTIVRPAETVRFSGRAIEQLPKGAIRRSIEMHIEQQQRFPLDTANNIRGRLRRHKFTVYKKGSKGISYVCAVRRKFRDPTTIFSPSIQGLIEFIETHPNIPAFKLPKLHIGIDTEKQTLAKLQIAEAKADEPPADAATDDSPPTRESDVATNQAAETEGLPPADAADSAAAPKEALGDEELKRFNQLMLDLRWLITEGYVTEYGDGRLFASPPLEAKSKDSAKQPDAATVEP